jgi:superfamily II DNA/RNA helicase
MYRKGKKQTISLTSPTQQPSGAWASRNKIISQSHEEPEESSNDPFETPEIANHHVRIESRGSLETAYRNIKNRTVTGASQTVVHREPVQAVAAAAAAAAPTDADKSFEEYHPVIDYRRTRSDIDDNDEGWGTRDEPEMNVEDTIPIYDTFESMGLKNELLRSIYSYGFEKPSEIQKKAIVQIVSGRNIISQAQSGTGKTGAFVIGSFQRIDQENPNPQVLILAPVRDLARQIYKVSTQLSQSYPITKCLLIGGEENIHEKINKQVIIGTPGRILENIRNQMIDVDSLKTIVLDEADRLLSQSFREQLAGILSNVNPNIQIALFSATMEKEIVDLALKFIQDPVKILINKNKISLEGIRQYYVYFQKEEYKIESLIEIYSLMSVSQSIIYSNFIEKTHVIYDKLLAAKFSVYYLHSNMTQQERNQIMDDFIKGKFRVLITTDVLARGIDVQQISLVINYDMCKELDTYLHRIGRSGRWGRKGIAINFVTYHEMKYIRQYEAHYNIKINTLPQNIQNLHVSDD